MAEEQRFIDNGDGTVTDTLTRLIWMKNDSYQDTKQFMTFTRARKYTEKKNQENFAGHSDWRIPQKKEAQSLFHYGKEHTVLDKYGMVLHIHPVFPEGGGYNTWTAETRGKITSFVFCYGDGSGVHQEVDGTVSTSVRLVRGEPNQEVLDAQGKIPPPKMVGGGGCGWR